MKKKLIMKLMKMNKIINKILIGLIIFCGTSLISTGFALAESSELTVDFEKTPLFSEANFLPGESILRYVDVTNISTETKKIGLNIVNDSECSTNCLSDVLNLVVNEDGNPHPIYSGSLTTFYGAGERILSNLNVGESTKYLFSITFNHSAENDYQNSTVDFNISIGSFGEESISGEISNTGGTIGGGYFMAGLNIYDEVSSSAEETSVTITWTTNSNSTSRVIYSPEGSPHLLYPNNPPNYGYILSTIEDPTKVTGHSVKLTSLIPNTTYYYRCVSHASPATISYEGTFTTSYSETYSEISGEEEIDKIGEEETEGASEEITSRTSEEEIEGIGEEEIDRTSEEETEGTEEIVIAPEEKQTKENPQLLAAIGSLVSFGTGNVPVGIVVSISILLIAFFIVKGIYTYIKKDK